MYRRAFITGAALVSALGLATLTQLPAQAATHAAQQHPTAGTHATSHASSTYKMYVTLYGAYDNTPGDSDQIAYPKNEGYPTLHDVASGVGTYSNPITFATDKSELPVGTRVYVPYMERYFMMEDDCTECDEDWTTSTGPSAPGYHAPHYRRIDLWAGDSHSSKIEDCEDNLTQNSQVSVIVDPPSNEKVVSTAIFNSSTDKCWSD